MISPLCKARAARYYRAHKQKILFKNKKYQVGYYQAHKEVMSASARAWKLANPGKMNAIGAKRRAAKRQATPPWLTAEHLKQMAAVYVEAKRMEMEDGIKRHVDHIYPIQNPTVCGLHVPWNLQILTARANNRKYNKLICR
jgi:hypothetical protein